MAIKTCTGNPNLDFIDFTDNTRSLLIRLQLPLMKSIESLKRDLELYKSLNENVEARNELISIVEQRLTQEKADLEQLKNL